MRCQCTGTMWFGDRCQHGQWFNERGKQLKNKNISECPEKIGGYAFGLGDAMLPLECQIAKK